MRRIGIICAMQKEYDLLVREFASDSVICALSGIGKVNAAMAAEKLVIDSRPDCLLSIGVAGTFVDGVAEGETVIVSRCAYHDVFCGKGYHNGQVPGMPLFFESDAALLEAARSALPSARCGLLCTGDQFYVSREEDLRQKSWFPEALAIDMEGTAVAQVAYANSIPFLALKIISDNHLTGNQRERYDGFWREMASRSFSSVHKLIDKLTQ